MALKHTQLEYHTTADNLHKCGLLAGADMDVGQKTCITSSLTASVTGVILGLEDKLVSL
jgi:hypothetical protein